METQENFKQQENTESIDENVEYVQILDKDEFARSIQEMRNNQNLARGITGGIIAGIVGAILWALISYVTDRQIGWMAVGVGLLVGMAVRIMGKGIDLTFGIAGATISFLSCLLGNFLTFSAFTAKFYDVSFGTVLGEMGLISNFLIESLDAYDILFYGLAIGTGYKASFINLEKAEE